MATNQDFKSMLNQKSATKKSKPKRESPWVKMKGSDSGC